MTFVKASINEAQNQTEIIINNLPLPFSSFAYKAVFLSEVDVPFGAATLPPSKYIKHTLYTTPESKSNEVKIILPNRLENSVYAIVQDIHGFFYPLGLATIDNQLLVDGGSVGTAENNSKDSSGAKDEGVNRP